MAALLIVGVIVVLVLLYTADRVRKARSRARRLHAMNDRLTVAAAQIDQEQDRRRAVARASAELTSVMPAIKRPPLTLPGVAGHEPGPPQDDQAAGDARPAAEEPVTEGPAAQEPGTEEPVAQAAPGTGGDRAGRPAGHTLTMPGLELGGAPVPPLRLTGEGTLIMSPVPAPPGGDGAAPDAAPGPGWAGDEPGPRRRPG